MNKRLVGIISIFLLLVLAVFLSLPKNYYITRALIYQTADIDDYKIFENRTVAAADGEPWLLHENFNEYTLTPEQENVLDLYQTVAFLVAQDSLLLFEAYWDDYGADSHSNSFSMAKSFVSLLIGCAIEDGYIVSLDQPIGDFIPEFSEGTKQQVTIRHLLTMSSGLSWDEAYASLFSTTTKAYYGKHLRELAIDQNVKSEPGDEYKYLSGNTQLLSIIISEATGRTLSDYASEKLWTKIGAEHDALWSLDRKDGVEKAYCCFNSNARDFARFGRLVLNNGRWNGEQVVPEWFIKKALTPATHLADVQLGGKPNTRYGFQWWITQHKGYDVYFARGILGQYVFVIPAQDIVAVRLGHKRSNERVEGNPIDIYQHLDIVMAIGADYRKSESLKEIRTQ